MEQPQICVTVTGRTTEELRRARDAADEADIVELRLDSVKRPDVAGALAGRRKPVLVTCRPPSEGGAFEGSEDERRQLLRTAIDLGAELVDVEANATFAHELIRARGGRGVVLSSHFFGGVPADLAARYRAMRGAGAEIVKLAVEVGSLGDSLPLFELASSIDGEPGPSINGSTRSPHVLVAMGDAGLPTRVLAAHLRNRWTYAGNAVAPGQVPADRLIKEFRIRRVAAHSAVYGVVGRPVLHSLSPVMHNSGFAALGLKAVYIPMQAVDAEDFLQFARGIGLRGASITAPFKVSLLSAVDELSPHAQRAGAINTIVVRAGQWFGANTDIEGFLRPLAGRINLRGVRATVLGAGGAARAVAIALSDARARVTVSARQPERAAEIARLAGGSVGAFPPVAGSWDVLVNATTAGSHAQPVNPIEGAALDGEIVFDLVYAPQVTPLLAAAERAGCLTIGGLEMLVAQAERQFELWTGQPPPQGLFHEAALQALASPLPSSVV
jgi:3-dehydroquinate dehydratase/shikimate dehydrogenase